MNPIAFASNGHTSILLILLVVILICGTAYGQDDGTTSPEPGPEPNEMDGETAVLDGWLSRDAPRFPPALKDLYFGQPASEIDPDLLEKRTVQAEEVEFEVDADISNASSPGTGGYLSRVEIRLPKDVAKGLLIALWGQPDHVVEEDPASRTVDTLYWFNRKDGVRAMLVFGQQLTLESMVSYEALIGKDQGLPFGFEPFPLLGAELKQLEDEWGPRVLFGSPDGALVTLPPTRFGGWMTSLSLKLTPEKTVVAYRLLIPFETDESRDKILQLLRDKLQHDLPLEDADSPALVVLENATVTVDPRDGRGFEVVVEHPDVDTP